MGRRIAAHIDIDDQTFWGDANCGSCSRLCRFRELFEHNAVRTTPTGADHIRYFDEPGDAVLERVQLPQLLAHRQQIRLGEIPSVPTRTLLISHDSEIC